MNLYREISWKIRALEGMRSAAFRKLSDFGRLSGGRLPVINYIIKHEGCTQQEIANTFGVSAPAITAAVKRLEKDGLITRNTDEANQRCNRLLATDEGVRLAKTCREEIAQIDREFFGKFDDEQLSALNGYLETMIESYSGKKWDFEGMRELLEKHKEGEEHV